MSVVILCALAGGVFLGVPSLVVGWVQGGVVAMHRVHDVGWGVFAVFLLSVPAAAQLRRPDRRPAAMQQLLLCLAVGGVAMVASGALVPAHVIRGALIATPAAVMFVLHPARARVLRPGRLSPILGALAVLAAVPLVRFALLQLSIQRIDRLSPHGVQFHWGTMATLVLAIAATLLVAALRSPGWRLSAWCAGLALASYGLVSGVYPSYASSVGRAWGIGAIAFAGVFVLTAELLLRAERRRPRRSRSRIPGGQPSPDGLPRVTS
ncbi:MAG: hypothetical protein ABI869_06630 [Actinomycetota bacterium]